MSECRSTIHYNDNEPTEFHHAPTDSYLCVGCAAAFTQWLMDGEPEHDEYTEWMLEADQ